MEDKAEGVKKFQASKMDKDGGMVVVRTDDKAEFESLIGIDVKEYFKGMGASTSTVVDKPYQASTGGFKRQEAGETCNKCGVAKIVLNPKTGKTFCEKKCWLNGAKSY